MKALIIAAGRGSRLKNLTEKEPKPLVQLLGLSLIERIILTAKEADINKFIIVTGYLSEKVKEKLGNGKKYGVKIDYIENKQWKKGNGISALQGRKFINDKFVLLMADHIFQADILKRLLQVKLEDNECCLAVDKAPKDYIDLNDATKVKIENDSIVNIGKEIKNYNAIDCGMFLCSQSLFKALEESIKSGDETLSGGVRILSKKKKMKPFDIKENFWIDVDTEKDFKEAERILSKNLTKLTDGPVSRFLNRPVSAKISKLLVKTKLKPNTISFFSFILCLISAFFFSLGSYLYIVIGGFLAQFSSVIDGCDGEVARLKFQETEYGAWFDAVLDRYADSMIILGITFGIWKLYNNVGIWIVGIFALIGSFMNSYTAIKYDSIFKKSGKKPRVRIGRDIRLLLIMIGALLNQLFYILVILGIITNVEAIRRLYVLRNKITS